MYSLKYQMILVDTWPGTSSNASHWTEKENWEMYCLWKTALLFWHSGLYFAHYFCFIELREIQGLFFETFYQWQCQWLPEELVRGALCCNVDTEFSAFHNIVFENFDLSLVIVWMKVLRLPQHCFRGTFEGHRKSTGIPLGKTSRKVWKVERRKGHRTCASAPQLRNNTQLVSFFCHKILDQRKNKVHRPFLKSNLWF